MSLAARLLPMMAARARLSAGLSGSSASASQVGNGPFSTNAITAIPSGGVGPYTYSWARTSGDASIAVSSAVAAAPTWSASGVAPQTKGAVWRCTITDAQGTTAVTGDVTVSVQFQVSSMSVSLDRTVATISGAGNGPFDTNRVVATPVGGTAPYTYAWERPSGDATILISDGTGIPNPFWVGSGTAPETKNAQWRCKVTDNVGTIAYSAEVAVSVVFTAPSLSATVDTTFLYGLHTGPDFGTATTDSAVTATPVGGVGGFSYAWEYVSGDSFTINSPSAAATTFSKSGSPTNYYSGLYRCKVTDSLGTVAYTQNVQVDLEFDSGI